MKRKLVLGFCEILSNTLSSIVTLCVLCCVFLPAFAFADFDVNLEALGRSYPESGYVAAQGGYDILIWGTAGPGNYMYGYVRPYIEGDTGGTYNSGLLGLEFFPISFLGGKIGKEWIQNDKNYHGADCATYNCEGSSAREFIEGHLLLGYGPWFASLAARWDLWQQKHPEMHDFIDPTSLLAARSDGDTEFVVNGFTGLEVMPMWSAVAGVSYYRMTRHPGISRFFIVGPRYKDGDLSVTAGGTYFSSTEVRKDFGAFIWVSWNLIPGLGLE